MNHCKSQSENVFSMFRTGIVSFCIKCITRSSRRKSRAMQPLPPHPNQVHFCFDSTKLFEEEKKNTRSIEWNKKNLFTSFIVHRKCTRRERESGTCSVYLICLSLNAEFIYMESDFPALNFTEFVMRNNLKSKTAKNEEMFQYIGVNNNIGGG